MKYLRWICCFLVLSSAAQAQVLYHHGTIYTVDSSFSLVDAMVVKDGKILRTGRFEMLQREFPNAVLYDLEGKVVYPGFIDAHCHFLGLGLSMQMVDLIGTSSPAEVYQRCEAYFAKHPSAILFGRGWDQNDWKESVFPDDSVLSVLFPNIPVVLKRIDGHAAWVNQYMLKLAGITGETKVSGGEVLCINGKPMGILIDNAVDLVMKYIPPLDQEYINSCLTLASDACVKYGLTSVVDAGLELDTLRKIESAYIKKLVPIRFSGMYASSEKCLNYISKAKNVYSTLPMFRQGLQDRFVVRGVKVFADGALGSRGACLKLPYSDRHAHHGFLLTPAESLPRIASLCFDKKLQMNVHCIGDSANGVVLSMMSKQLSGMNDRRWRVEHAQVLDPKDIYLFGKYGIIPSVQPTHATSDMPWAPQRLGAQRMKTAYAYKSLLNQNNWLPLGTDFPVEEVSTFKTFCAAVFRTDERGLPEGGFQPENALSREEAIRGMTIWAAKSIFEENNRGSLEPGKWADFVILNVDLMKATFAEIKQAKVLATYIGGSKVYGN